MATEIYPSSFRCDCGVESDFTESAMWELKRMSERKKQRLGDDNKASHTIVFDKGKAIEIHCPKLGVCKLTDFE
jgi:hypothetical protein